MTWRCPGTGNLGIFTSLTGEGGDQAVKSIRLHGRWEEPAYIHSINHRCGGKLGRTIKRGKTDSQAQVIGIMAGGLEIWHSPKAGCVQICTSFHGRKKAKVAVSNNQPESC